MKTAILVVIGILITVLLVGLALNIEVAQREPVTDTPEDMADTDEKTYSNGLEKVLEMKNFYYLRDKVTDVMYICYREKIAYSGMGGMTAMLDPESGLPLTYERYLELEAQKEDE